MDYSNLNRCIEGMPTLPTHLGAATSHHWVQNTAATTHNHGPSPLVAPSNHVVHELFTNPNPTAGNYFPAAVGSVDNPINVGNHVTPSSLPQIGTARRPQNAKKANTFGSTWGPAVQKYLGATHPFSKCLAFGCCCSVNVAMLPLTLSSILLCQGK